ncbi:MAG: pilus assembly protein PilM [Candidatus Omnitrophica bacterium]|nr:pilus assembly protein PilM [Candidatus Omnitrophota bacterium]
MVFAKEKKIATIDISDDCIKVIAVSFNKGDRLLYVIDRDEIKGKKEKDIAKEVRAFVSKNKLAKAVFYLSFPRHLVTIRNIQLPAVNDGEVKNMAELQAVKYLPYSKEDMVISHKVIEKTKDGYTNILLILVPRKSIDKHMEIFKQAGIPIEQITLNSEGLFNWYKALKVDDQRPVAVIELDRRHTQIQIIRDKKMLFSRSISFDITSSPRDESALIRELRLSFDSFVKEFDQRISRIVVTGAKNYADSLRGVLSESLQAKCEVLAQMQNIKLDDATAVSSSFSNESSFASLLGVALNTDNLEIDLLPSDVIDKRKEHVFKNELIRTGILLLAVLVAAFGTVEKKMRDKRSYLRKMDKMLKDMEPEVKRLIGYKEEIELIQHQISPQASVLDILREIYSLLPADISLTLFEYEDENRVLIRGTADDLSTAFKLLPLLEESPYLHNVKINYATKRVYKGQEFADFEILCELSK